MKRKMNLPGRQQARGSYSRSCDCLKRRALGAATAAIKEEKRRKNWGQKNDRARRPANAWVARPIIDSTKQLKRRERRGRREEDTTSLHSFSASSNALAVAYIGPLHALRHDERFPGTNKERRKLGNEESVADLRHSLRRLFPTLQRSAWVMGRAVGLSHQYPQRL